MSWDSLIDELSTKNSLTHFTPKQVEATVALLAVVMHADQRAGFLEQQAFEDLIGQLPFYEGKGATSQQIESAIGEARAAADEGNYRAIVDTVATHIDDPKDRREVYRLAANIAYADHHMNAAESSVMSWLAAAFSIEDAEKILDSVD